MDEQTGINGNFQRSLPGNGIPEGYNKCLVCGIIIPNGIITMARHDAECGGKELFDKIEKLGELYKNKQIDEAEFTKRARMIYGIPFNEDAELTAIEKFLLNFNNL